MMMGLNCSAMDNKRLIEFVQIHEELYVAGHPKYTDNVHKDEVWERIGFALNQPGLKTHSRKQFVSTHNDQEVKFRTVFPFKKVLDGDKKEYDRPVKAFKKICLEMMMGLNCSVMDNKRLIEFVQIHEELYVAGHPKYTDNVHKDEVWERIALALNQPVSLCKRAWFNLRDSFRRALRKRRDAFNDGLSYRKWRYDEQMAFLEPHILIRDKEEHTRIYEFPHEDSIQPKLEETDDSYDGAVKRKRESYMVPPLVDNYEPRNLQLDHIEAFLLGIGATLKNFSPYYQNIAKSKIFALVSEIEMEQIMECKKVGNTNLAEVACKAEREWPSPDRISLHDSDDSGDPAISLEISGNQ